MNYQDAMERAIALRLRAKKEVDQERKRAMLDLAREWEIWAEQCRDREAKGEASDPGTRPKDDV